MKKAKVVYDHTLEQITRVKEDDLQDLNLGIEGEPKILKISVHIDILFKEQLDKGTKRQRAVAVQWDDKNTHTLLRVYEETWAHIKKGNFRQKDWEDLTLSLNREIAGTYNPENARNRIDVLKKTHKKELTKQNSSGASPSSWPLFKLCDGLWGKTPKASGIAGAFDSDSRATSSTAPFMEAHIDMDNVEDGNSTQNPQVGPSSSEVELEGVFGKKVKQSSKSSLGAFTRTVGLQLQGLSEAIMKAEENKLSVFERIEMARMEHELKMQQNNLNMQLEIAKLYGSRRQDYFCCTFLDGLTQYFATDLLQFGSASAWLQLWSPSRGVMHRGNATSEGFVREPIQAEKALACVLWRLAQGHSSKSEEEFYGLGESTIRKYVLIICRILSHNVFFQRYGICVPEGERLTKIMEDYEAITAGGVHDSTHFKDSSIYSSMKRGEALDRPRIVLQGEVIRPYLLADSAYKAKTFVVKPFRVKAGLFVREEREFDRKLSKGRVKIENAFSLLKNRWRILRELNVDITSAPAVVAACCLLHNFVQLRGEVEPQEQDDPHQNSEEALSEDGNPRGHKIASRVRAALFRYICLVGAPNREA
ncbi:hypothetical protein L7F22_007778 [Adiantum nelumboides]|nr:hypothetical protein [Adiantum nelumboides]